MPSPAPIKACLSIPIVRQVIVCLAQLIYIFLRNVALVAEGAENSITFLIKIQRCVEFLQDSTIQCHDQHVIYEAN